MACVCIRLFNYPNLGHLVVMGGLSRLVLIGVLWSF